MEKGLFYLPCGNNVDDMPPSFEGWYNPHQRWNGWYAPLFNKETYDKICAYYSDPKTNTQESIDDLKEFIINLGYPGRSPKFFGNELEEASLSIYKLTTP